MPFKKKTIPPDAAFDFNAAVKEAYKNYPKLKRKAVFYDAANNKVHGKNPLLKGWTRLSGIKKKARHGSRVTPKIRGKASAMIYTQGSRENVIDGTGGGSFVFDHELGHLLTGNLFIRLPKTGGLEEYYDYLASQTKYESIADAYAILRHFQRCGTDSADVPKIAVYRAWESMQSGLDTSHLSSSVIAGIWADRHKIDFLSLSPEETWQKALEYAEKYALNGNEVGLIRQGYSMHSLRPKDKLLKNGEAFEVDTWQLLELAATTCLTAQNPNVFIVGAAIVVPHVTATQPILTDPDWFKVVDKMQERAQQLGVDNLLDMFKENTADITKGKELASPEDLTICSAKEQRAAITRLLKL